MRQRSNLVAIHRWQIQAGLIVRYLFDNVFIRQNPTVGAVMLSPDRSCMRFVHLATEHHPHLCIHLVHRVEHFWHLVVCQKPVQCSPRIPGQPTDFVNPLSDRISRRIPSIKVGPLADASVTPLSSLGDHVFHRLDKFIPMDVCRFRYETLQI